MVNKLPGDCGVLKQRDHIHCPSSLHAPSSRTVQRLKAHSRFGCGVEEKEEQRVRRIAKGRGRREGVREDEEEGRTERGNGQTLYLPAVLS